MTRAGGTPTGRRHDERGVALPSGVVVLSILAVALAALAFLTTGDEPGGVRARTVADAAATREPQASTAGSPGPAATPEPTPTAEPRPPLRRGEVFVEVYNNTGIQDLAASAAAKADAAGWNVVSTDNWLGTVPTTTVYHPPRLLREARALARDLGISRTARAIEPMGLDRLTVILTLDHV